MSKRPCLQLVLNQPGVFDIEKSERAHPKGECDGERENERLSPRVEEKAHQERFAQLNVHARV
jgi:hypothetical protein